jgi:hypothetical protein
VRDYNLPLGSYVGREMFLGQLDFNKFLDNAEVVRQSRGWNKIEVSIVVQQK